MRECHSAKKEDDIAFSIKMQMSLNMNLKNVQ